MTETIVYACDGDISDTETDFPDGHSNAGSIVDAKHVDMGGTEVVDQSVVDSSPSSDEIMLNTPSSFTVGTTTASGDAIIIVIETFEEADISAS